ncbi:MAG: hypothetical protein AAF346_22330 [Pseudomonadota bacterium]
MTPGMIRELQNISQQHVDNLVGNVFAELDKLKADIQAVNKSRPDPDLLIKNIEPFTYFEFIALACHRLRGKWKRANDAVKTLEKRRNEWNTVISAALFHARNDLTKLEKGSAEYDAQIDKILALLDMLSLTFRPLAGPNAQWVAITAATIGTSTQ